MKRHFSCQRYSDKRNRDREERAKEEFSLGKNREAKLAKDR